jgi:hypothetical protein
MPYYYAETGCSRPLIALDFLNLLYSHRQQDDDDDDDGCVDEEMNDPAL